MKYMDIKEFREFGYLHEVNRQWFHPLGLALVIKQGNDGEGWELDGIMDARDEPEGVIFAEELLSEEKYNRVVKELAKRAVIRIKKLGYIVQPIKD